MRSRLRTLHTGASRYTWKVEILHIQGRADCHRGARVRVWAAGKNSRALQVDLLSTAGPSPWGACATDGAYPTPADVRALIAHAEAHGWTPTGAGTFHLTEASGVRLPDFLVTDCPTDPTAPDPTTRVIEAAQQSRTG